MQRLALAFAAVIACTAQVCAQDSHMQMDNHQMKSAATPSHELVIKADGSAKTFTLADLQAMPQQSVRVHNGHNNQDEVYTGVPLSVILSRYGISTAEGAPSQKLYHSYVRAEGTDKYFVLYSASELEPELHTWDAIVALSMDGKPLGPEGDFKIVTGGERKPARWVRNLASLTIVTVQ